MALFQNLLASFHPTDRKFCILSQSQKAPVNKLFYFRHSLVWLFLEMNACFAFKDVV